MTTSKSSSVGHQEDAALGGIKTNCLFLISLALDVKSPAPVL